jgi:hypothetical protein
MGLRRRKESKINLWGTDSFAQWSDSGSEEAMAEPDNAAGGAQPQPNPNEKLVKVFDSEIEPEAMVVKGLLESAGIDCDLTAAAMVQDVYPGLGGVIILVREEDADKARRLIGEQQRMSLAEDDETAEIETTEEPPPKP